MSSAITYSTGANTSMIISGGITPAPISIPKKDLVSYRVVEMKEGWVSQVIVDGEIVKEKVEFKTSRDAENWATAHIAKRMKKLFA